MISETNIDDSFSIGNFVINGYSTLYRLDKYSNGGGILLYKREGVQSYLTATENKPVKSFHVEVNRDKQSLGNIIKVS